MTASAAFPWSKSAARCRLTYGLICGLIYVNAPTTAGTMLRLSLQEDAALSVLTHDKGAPGWCECGLSVQDCCARPAPSRWSSAKRLSFARL